MWGFLERWFGRRRPGWYPPGVVSRVVGIPTPYSCHPDILQRLRDLHRDLDYFPTPAGRVLLLQHQPGKPRIEMGRRMLERPYRSGRSRHDAHLLAQGFALLADLPYRSLYDGQLLSRAERIIHVTPAEVEAWHSAALAESDGTAADARALAAMRESLYADRNAHRILFGKRKSPRVRSA